MISGGQSGNKLAQMLVEKYQLGPKMQLLLEQAGLRWSAARLVHLTLVASFLARFALAWFWLLPHSVALAFWWSAGRQRGPDSVRLATSARARLSKVSKKSSRKRWSSWPRSMRAGHAFSVSLEMIHREFPEPMSGEFRRTFEEHNLGLPIEVALQKLAKRVPSLDVHFFVSAVLLQKRTGGNLAEILDKLAYVIRERFKLRGRIRAVSAHGRMTATALSCIPDRGGGSDVLHQSGLRQVLLHRRRRQHHAGRGRGLLQLIGYVIMQKIVNIEV